MSPKIKSSDIKKTFLQIDVDLYKKLMKLRKLKPDSELRLEAVRTTIKRLYDFYLENGGEIPNSK